MSTTGKVCAELINRAFSTLYLQTVSQWQKVCIELLHRAPGRLKFVNMSVTSDSAVFTVEIRATGKKETEVCSLTALADLVGTSADVGSLFNLDWSELRKQKEWLIKQRTDEADGLLGVIDALQDTALHVMGIPEEDIFGTPEDAGEVSLCLVEESRMRALLKEAGYANIEEIMKSTKCISIKQ